MKTVAIIQARMGSTRLPGKVLKQVRGASILEHVLGRVRAARLLDAVCVATTRSSTDDPLVQECGRLDADVYRGSEQDVLARYHGAAASLGATVVVRITSDCPLYDPEMLDELLGEWRTLNGSEQRVDYLSNCTLRRTFPRGLDTEIFTFAALDRAFREAASSHEREHVTPYLYGHPELFRLRSYEGNQDLSHHRWTLDTPEDLAFVESVYGELHDATRLFTTADVLKLLKARPELMKLNADVAQKHHDNTFQST